MAGPRVSGPAHETTGGRGRDAPMRNMVFALLALLSLAACGAESVWAPDEAVEAVRYRHDGPPRLTLFTMKAISTGAGTHTALMINAPEERIIFDPSGPFKASNMVERNDVLHGATPDFERKFIASYTQKRYYFTTQELDVSPEVAQQAYRLAITNGAVPNAQCATSTANLLNKLPGMEFIKPAMSPVKLQNQFAQVPGVRAQTFRGKFIGPEEERRVELIPVTDEELGKGR